MSGQITNMKGLKVIPVGVKGFAQCAALCLALAISAAAKDEILVNAQPAEPGFAMGTDVVLKVTLTNHTQQKLTYFPCPRPYSVEVSDAKGSRVDPRPAHPENENEEVSVCAANPLITVDRGKTVNDTVKLTDLYELLPGAYKVKLRWHFQISFHETSGGAESRSIAVVSNTAVVTVK